MSIWFRRLARLGRNLKKVAGVIALVTALLKKGKKDAGDTDSNSG